MTKVKRASEEEIQKEYIEKYDKVLQAPTIGEGIKYEKEGAILVLDEHGLLQLPDFREVKCSCGRKLKIYLAQKIPPVWANRCPRCRGLHFRGETQTIENATEQQKRQWLKKAKETRRHGFKEGT